MIFLLLNVSVRGPCYKSCFANNTWFCRSYMSLRHIPSSVGTLRQRIAFAWCPQGPRLRAAPFFFVTLKKYVCEKLLIIAFQYSCCLSGMWGHVFIGCLTVGVVRIKYDWLSSRDNFCLGFSIDKSKTSWLIHVWLCAVISTVIKHDIFRMLWRNPLCAVCCSHKIPIFLAITCLKDTEVTGALGKREYEFFKVNPLK